MEQDFVELKVEGMTCVNCAASVTRFLERKGLEDVAVNYATGDVRFRALKPDTTLEQLSAGIQKLGYRVVSQAGRQHGFGASLEQLLVVSAIFTFPLLGFHLLMLVGVPKALQFLHEPWVQFAICLPVYLIGFFHFGRSAWSSLRSGVPNMDVLIFIGSTAAFVYSVIGTLMHQHDYIFYETAATIITLVLFGNWLEHRAVKKTTSAIDDLGRLRAESARKVMPSGAVVTLPIAEIAVGDTLQVNEGDQVPTDGRILQGSDSIALDESMLTGESIPVPKSASDSVTGGSVVVAGSFRMEATATGQHTVLSRMIDMVKNAQQEKPAIQRLADRVSAIFVPVVTLIAALTFGLGHWMFDLPVQNALMNAIAVLVISCPCAMGLATPTAVMVGVGRMARHGILVKGGQTLEVFANIRNFVFDKTGTLTTGQFRVNNFQVHEGSSEDARDAIVALEYQSSHPIARSLVAAFNPSHTPPRIRFISFREMKGLGVEGTDEEGNLNSFGSASLSGNGNGADESRKLLLTKNGLPIASLEIQDDLKPGVRELIGYLKGKGKNAVLLSGDKTEATAAVADEAGIGTYFAEKMPEEKLQIIQSLSQKEPTAMIGDGINDAPAMARATLGVSLSDASKVAIQSAQVVLLNGKIQSLQQALAIGRITLLTIRQNLFWAFAYNVVAIPVAAMGYLNPMWGALFMAFSDVVVIGNSIRLNWKRLDV